MYRWNLTNGKNVVQNRKMPSCFLKNYGMIFIFKLYGMEENIHQLGWDLRQ
jgi:hypothetical protein